MRTIDPQMDVEREWSDRVMPAADDVMERYIAAAEAVADDPDAPVPADFGLLRSYAVQGAAIGLRHGMPLIVSVDKAFLDRAAGGRA